MGDGEDLRHFVAPGRDVDKVHLAVELPRDGYTLVDAVPALVAGRPADADVDREAPAALPLDPVDDGQGEPAAVLQAPAPLVLPVVHVGIEELVEQPAVPGVDGHHPKSAELGERRRVAEGLDGLLDDLLGHGGDELPQRVDPVDCAVYLVAAGRADVGVRPGVQKLHGRHRPVPVDGRRQTVERRKRRGVVQIGVAQPDHAPLAVRGCRAVVHRRRASHGLALEEGDGLVEGVVLRREILVAHRRREQAVPEDGVSQPDGTEEMRILARVHGAP